MICRKCKASFTYHEWIKECAIIYIQTFKVRCFFVNINSHTSGRPCKGNASVTAFFMPREAVWNQTKGWLKAFEKRKAAGLAGNEEPPEYFRLSALSPKDFHMYLEYDYRFIDYVSAFSFLGFFVHQCVLHSQPWIENTWFSEIQSSLGVMHSRFSSMHAELILDIHRNSEKGARSFYRKEMNK